jgi:hypothetical protein
VALQLFGGFYAALCSFPLMVLFVYVSWLLCLAGSFSVVPYWLVMALSAWHFVSPSAMLHWSLDLLSSCCCPVMLVHLLVGLG